MKKQLEENQKQLATQQEDATATKNRLRELTKVTHTHTYTNNAQECVTATKNRLGELTGVNTHSHTLRISLKIRLITR